MKKTFLFCLFILTGTALFGQHDFYTKGDYSFSEADTLRGMLRPERTCYDVNFYGLNIKIDPDKRSLNGFVEMAYSTLEDFQTLQIDLYQNMDILKISHHDKELDFRRIHNAVFVDFPKIQKKGKNDQIKIYYRGIPQPAMNPPWDGGFVWRTDNNGKPWIGVACEGDGASLWWPNKDHLSDEPDSMAINVTVPDGLTCVANGNLRSIDKKGDFNTFNWFVSYPINNYNVTVNIADYAHFTETYTSFEGDSLELDYYVLSYNLKKAKKHFQQVHKVLACFEKYFGKYPFWNDGFGMVETPYLGMEHQGAIAYGNNYKRGYMGGMIPRDMNWDYIIVHETGHEYFGNSVSCNDLAEMWIHESFTTYMEALYVECIYSYADAVRYLGTQRYYIGNREPILGPKDVNWEDWGHSDHYYKGAWVLHTLRHAINDDNKWFDLLHGFYQKYAIKNITTQDFIDYVNTCTQQDYSSFFDQYLEYPNIPVLEYQQEEQGNDLKVSFRWQADADGFNMPVMVGKKDNYQMIYPSTGEWKSTVLKKTSKKEFKVATELFLIRSKKVKK